MQRVRKIKSDTKLPGKKESHQGMESSYLTSKLWLSPRQSKKTKTLPLKKPVGIVKGALQKQRG